MPLIRYTPNEDYNLSANFDAIGGVKIIQSPIFIGNSQNIVPGYFRDNTLYVYNGDTGAPAQYIEGGYIRTTESGLFIDASDLTDSITIIGGTFGDILRGGSGDDTLNGGDGNDILEGGAGADTFDGGDGIDTISYEHSIDAVAIVLRGKELGYGSGNDSYGDRYVNIENGRGGFGDDAIYSYLDGDLNVLEGGGGADYFVTDIIDVITYKHSLEGVYVDLFNGLGDGGDALGDVYYNAQNAEGSSYSDTLIGTQGANILRGGGGADTLIGGLGADVMIGGVGSDRYFVDNVGDVVVELADEGTDTVESTIDYVLGENVERLVLAGAAITGTGNELGNAIFGTEGNNFLYGSLGRDTLQGNGGDDYLDGGADIDTMKGGLGADTYVVDNKNDKVVELADEGIDTVQASVSHTLRENVENLSLTGTENLTGNGNALSNVIVGNSGNNTLSGGAGTNTLMGGDGNDTYVVTSSTDVIIEKAGEGSDTIRSTVSYTMGEDVEKMVLGGTADLDATGSSTGNTIYGNAGDNEIAGAGGRDVLYGRDGADSFVFNAITDSTVSSSGRDVIKDFSIAQGDKIDLSGIDLGEGSTFTFIGTNGFSKTAGEVNIKFSGANTIVQADTDGNGKADFSVFLVGHQDLTADQFVLDHGTLIV